MLGWAAEDAVVQALEREARTEALRLLGASLHVQSSTAFLRAAHEWCGGETACEGTWTFIDFYAGIGTTLRCLQAFLGNKVVCKASVEVLTSARRVLRRAMGDDAGILLTWAHTKETRARLVEMGPVDHVHGSPECAPHSKANRLELDSVKRREQLEGWLKEAVAWIRTAATLRPRLITMENSATLTEEVGLRDQWERFRVILAEEAWEYDFRLQVVRAEEHGDGLTGRTRLWVAGKWRE
jgi:site-specific DNA-cytosine methylase